MNNELKDDLIKFSTAKLAKIAGFSVPVLSYYMGSKNLFSWEEPTNGNNPDFTKEIYSAPTQTLLAKWIRKKFNYNVCISYKPNIKKWDYIIYDLSLKGKEYVIYYSQYNKDHPSRRFDEPEEALEAAFKEFFEEILITKSQLI